MKQIMTDGALAALGAGELAYIREVSVEDVWEDLRAHLEGKGQEMDLDPSIRLFSIHAADGTRMALVDSLEAAIWTARSQEMEPVKVH